MMEGLGYGREEITNPDAKLTREAVEYRDFLDKMSLEPPWIRGAALLTIFVEGSVHERAEREGRREILPIEDAVREHPLVKHYACPPDAMQLTRAHHMVEGGHREDAWEMVLRYAPSDRPGQDALVSVMEDALRLWLLYRDSVVEEMGIRG